MTLISLIVASIDNLQAVANISPNSFLCVAFYTQSFIHQLEIEWKIISALPAAYSAWLEHCEQTPPCTNIWTITGTNREI